MLHKRQFFAIYFCSEKERKPKRSTVEWELLGKEARVLWVKTFSYSRSGGPKKGDSYGFGRYRIQNKTIKILFLFHFWRTATYFLFWHTKTVPIVIVECTSVVAFSLAMANGEKVWEMECCATGYIKRRKRRASSTSSFIPSALLLHGAMARRHENNFIPYNTFPLLFDAPFRIILNSHEYFPFHSGKPGSQTAFSCMCTVSRPTRLPFSKGEEEEEKSIGNTEYSSSSAAAAAPTHWANKQRSKSERRGKRKSGNHHKSWQIIAYATIPSVAKI